MLCRCSCREPAEDAVNRGREMDPDVAWRLIQHSIAVYSKPEEIREWTCSSCEALGGRARFSIEKYSKVPVRPMGTTAFYIGYDHLIPGIVVSFRGTAVRLNWVGNIRMTKPIFDAPFKTAKKFGMPIPDRIEGDLHAHNGFYKFYKALQGRSDEITESLRKLLSWRNDQGRYLRGNVYFTGHSMGGALAVLAAADLAPFINSYSKKHYHEAHRRPIMYNFAAPRAGDTCLVEFYHRHVFESFRLAHSKKDRVVHLPPRFGGKLPGCPYEHVLKLVSLSERNFDLDRGRGGSHGKKKYLDTVQNLYFKLKEITEDDILNHQQTKKLDNDAGLDYID